MEHERTQLLRVDVGILGTAALLTCLGGCYAPSHIAAATDVDGTEGDTGSDSTTALHDSDDSAASIEPSTHAVAILFVMDTRGTMGPAQARLAAGAPTLFGRLDELAGDWRSGFTTTDNGHPFCHDTSPEAGALQLSSCRSRLGEFLSERVFRPLLLVLGETEHVLLGSMHHIASDGWSTGVLVREVGALYAALAAGRPSPLPELPV